MAKRRAEHFEQGQTWPKFGIFCGLYLQIWLKNFKPTGCGFFGCFRFPGSWLDPWGRGSSQHFPPSQHFFPSGSTGVLLKSPKTNINQLRVSCTGPKLPNCVEVFGYSLETQVEDYGPRGSRNGAQRLYFLGCFLRYVPPHSLMTFQEKLVFTQRLGLTVYEVNVSFHSECILVTGFVFS